MADTALPALVEALRRLPGVGVKSASRMAYHLLQHDRAGARALSVALAVDEFAFIHGAIGIGKADVVGGEFGLS